MTTRPRYKPGGACEQRPRIFLSSLGCDKNLVDAESMLGQLRDGGYIFTNEAEEADVIIVNTCCFIDAAKEESIEEILRLAPYRTEGNCKALIVTGCMGERYRREIKEELPEVDAVLGTAQYAHISKTVAALFSLTAAAVLPEDAGAFRKNRILLSGAGTGYLKIAEGCDKHCTYCVIPSVRGVYKSFPMEELLYQARRMAEDGVRELIVVAQETTRYGVDLYGEKRLPALLKELAKVEGIAWIRLLYAYPEEITDELVNVMQGEPKICRYLDIPIQHCNNDVLRRMGRKTTKEDLTRIIAGLREHLPDIALRTTLISGFPGETKAQHQELLAFIRDMRFDRLGVFPYSREEGTPAAAFPGQVTETEKQKRKDALMRAQQVVSEGISGAFIGKTLTVFVEGRLPEEDVYVGRTYRDAPEVDGYVFFTADAELLSGAFVRVNITGADVYDLMGEAVYEPAE